MTEISKAPTGSGTPSTGATSAAAPTGKAAEKNLSADAALVTMLGEFLATTDAFSDKPAEDASKVAKEEEAQTQATITANTTVEEDTSEGDSSGSSSSESSSQTSAYDMKKSENQSSSSSSSSTQSSDPFIAQIRMSPAGASYEFYAETLDAAINAANANMVTMQSASKIAATAGQLGFDEAITAAEKGAEQMRLQAKSSFAAGGSALGGALVGGAAAGAQYTQTKQPYQQQKAAERELSGLDTTKSVLTTSPPTTPNDVRMQASKDNNTAIKTRTAQDSATIESYDGVGAAPLKSNDPRVTNAQAEIDALPKDAQSLLKTGKIEGADPSTNEGANKVKAAQEQIDKLSPDAQALGKTGFIASDDPAAGHMSDFKKYTALKDKETVIAGDPLPNDPTGSKFRAIEERIPGDATPSFGLIRLPLPDSLAKNTPTTQRYTDHSTITKMEAENPAFPKAYAARNAGTLEPTAAPPSQVRIDAAKQTLLESDKYNYQEGIQIDKQIEWQAKQPDSPEKTQALQQLEGEKQQFAMKGANQAERTKAVQDDPDIKKFNNLTEAKDYFYSQHPDQLNSTTIRTAYQPASDANITQPAAATPPGAGASPEDIQAHQDFKNLETTGSVSKSREQTMLEQNQIQELKTKGYIAGDVDGVATKRALESFSDKDIANLNKNLEKKSAVATKELSQAKMEQTQIFTTVMQTMNIITSLANGVGEIFKGMYSELSAEARLAEGTAQANQQLFQSSQQMANSVLESTRQQQSSVQSLISSAHSTQQQLNNIRV